MSLDILFPHLRDFRLLSYSREATRLVLTCERVTQSALCPQYGTILWEELKTRGYRGSLRSVYRRLAKWREHPPKRATPASPGSIPRSPFEDVTPGQVIGWIEQWIAAWNAHHLDAIVEQPVLVYACSSESSCLAFS